jgi:hypothetical protein
MSLNQTEIRKTRRSGLIGATILLIIASLHLRKGHIKPAYVLYCLSATLFIMAGFFPTGFKRVTHAIGDIITKAILGIIYYVVITPFGLLMRLFGKDQLDKKIDKNRDTYWIKKEQTEDISNYERQF